VGASCSQWIARSPMRKGGGGRPLNWVVRRLPKVPNQQTFEVGKTYFSVFYADRELHHPLFETLVYVGLDTAEGDSGSTPMHLFQYARSFHADGNWSLLTDEQRAGFEEPPIMSYAVDEVDPLVDANGLIEELKEWRSRIK